jgi:aminotransferase
VYGVPHVSIASLEGMYERTVSAFTFSKSFAMTGLRLGYVALADARLRDRIRKLLFLTASNVSSIVQFGGIGGLEAGMQPIADVFRRELGARRDRFYEGIARVASHVFTGAPPLGAFYAFLRIDPGWCPPAGHPAAGLSSRSWQLCEYVIREGRIGCVPGVDFGPHGEGYVRFCFARERIELDGALDGLARLFAS